MPQKSHENKRSLYWGFLAYPESVSENWIEVLSVKYGLDWCRSPLHDRDVFNEGDGVLKKPHWHCLIVFSSLKSYQQVKEITDEIKATIPQIVHNPKGNVRYMLHKDNPEKAQYELKDLMCFNGFKADKFIFPDAEELKEKRLDTLKEIYAFIEEQGITEFFQINNYARLNEPYWFELLNTNSAYAVNLHIKSIRNSIKNGK